MESRVRFLSRNVSMAVGSSSELSLDCEKVASDVNSMLAKTVHELRCERDGAKSHIFEERANFDFERKRLIRDLNATADNAKFFEDQNGRLKDQLKIVQEEAATATAESLKFRQHHNTIVNGYKDQDEINFSRIQVCCQSHHLHGCKSLFQDLLADVDSHHRDLSLRLPLSRQRSLI